ncbi:hypothetical protein KIPB_008445 [Kipferlia bialata]|uniref:Macro domain-containing protein n=1 Tax=Kipferlia bialata TaxID=797122 RepID=A0A9K3D0P5_9EUKA|nr:hypothetical protein KIPB_008445 [Kipferlia bialata]|eukprot:g8445.t1
MGTTPVELPAAVSVPTGTPTSRGGDSTNEALNGAVIYDDPRDIFGDVLVIAADTRLNPIDRTGHSAGAVGGIDIQREAREYVNANAPLDVGQCLLMGGQKLSYRWIVHAVVPRLHNCILPDGYIHLVSLTVTNALSAAAEANARSIVFACFSSEFCFPHFTLAELVQKQACQRFAARTSSIQSIRLPQCPILLASLSQQEPGHQRHIIGSQLPLAHQSFYLSVPDSRRLSLSQQEPGHPRHIIGSQLLLAHQSVYLIGPDARRLMLTKAVANNRCILALRSRQLA